MSLISSTMLSLDSVVSLNNVVPRIWAEVEKDSDGLGLYALTIASAPADVAAGPTGYGSWTNFPISAGQYDTLGRVFRAGFRFKM